MKRRSTPIIRYIAWKKRHIPPVPVKHRLSYLERHERPPDPPRLAQQGSPGRALSQDRRVGEPRRDTAQAPVHGPPDFPPADGGPDVPDNPGRGGFDAGRDSGGGARVPDVRAGDGGGGLDQSSAGVFGDSDTVDANFSWLPWDPPDDDPFETEFE